MHIEPANLTDPRVIELIRLHLAGMHSSSPPGHSFALDASGLSTPDVSLYVALEGGAVAGMGALKSLGPHAGEIQSMRTSPAFLRRGVGAAILEHIITEANRRGYERLSLETGTGEAFEPALALYRKRGFKPGPAFGGYVASEFNQFLHLSLV